MSSEYREDQLLATTVSVSARWTGRRPPEAARNIYREAYRFTGRWALGRRVYSQPSGGYHLIIYRKASRWSIRDRSVVYGLC